MTWQKVSWLVGELDPKDLSPIEKAISSSVSKFVEGKKVALVNMFWNGLDGVSMTAMCVLCLLAMFGLDAPKKWMVWIVAIYVTLQFLKHAWKLL